MGTPDATSPALPVDADVTARDRHAWTGRVRIGLHRRGEILLVIAGGGALGSLARFALATALPHDAAHVAWGTLAANLVGSFALGALMVFVIEVWPTARLVRPFLGVGVLGGFTTFSTYMLDTRGLLAAGQELLAAGYLFGTLVAGLAAIWAGIIIARLALVVLRRRRLSRGRATR